MVNAKEAGIDYYVGVDAVAESLHCSRMTIYRRCKDRSLPFVKIGGKLLFRKSDVTAWVDSLRVTQEGTAS